MGTSQKDFDAEPLIRRCTTLLLMDCAEITEALSEFFCNESGCTSSQEYVVKMQSFDLLRQLLVDAQILLSDEMQFDERKFRDREEHFVHLLDQIKLQRTQNYMISESGLSRNSGSASITESPVRKDVELF